MPLHFINSKTQEQLVQNLNYLENLSEVMLNFIPFVQVSQKDICKKSSQLLQTLTCIV